MRYSPRPLEDYHLMGVEPDFVDGLLRHDDWLPMWNLFWLSNPTLDSIPGSGKNWWRSYQTVTGGLQAVMDDVAEDDPLRENLLKQPKAFAAWFRAEKDPSIFDAYYVFGGDKWVENVLKRADEAAERLNETGPRVLIAGNVFNVDFRRRRA